MHPWPSARSGAHDLSKAAAFVLGPLTVDPPTRYIAAGERSDTLEPRVMRVLVALAAANGKVLSRDDLIELCWDGLIVGNNAVDRVISRLRHTFAVLAGDEVRLETITKVGFRIVSRNCSDFERDVPAIPLNHATAQDKGGGDDKAGGDEISPVRALHGAFDRRRFATGGLVAVAVAALGYGGWVRATTHRPDPEAARLLARGNTVMRSARMGSTPEAIKLYGQAVKVDPDYADAWGALASSYRHALDGYGKGERQSYPSMVRSAANRALAIDPAQPDALLAKVTIYPEYPNWLTQERELRALVERFPEHWYANARMGIVLQEVGRFDDALAFTRKVPRIDPQLAPAWAGLIRTLTMAGRFHEADAAYDEAMTHIAPHPAVWFTRLSSLLESRRFAEAAAFTNDPRALPEEFPEQITQTYGKLASALAEGETVGIAQSIAYIEGATKEPDYIPRGAPLLAALGATDKALEVYATYLFGGKFNGVNFPRPDSLDLRTMQPLFGPSMIALRGDPRHAEILRRSGVEEYWRRSGSQPDFRRS